MLEMQVWTSTGIVQLTFFSHSKPVAKSRVQIFNFILKYRISHPFCVMHKGALPYKEYLLTVILVKLFTTGRAVTLLFILWLACMLSWEISSRLCPRVIPLVWKFTVSFCLPCQCHLILAVTPCNRWVLAHVLRWLTFTLAAHTIETELLDHRLTCLSLALLEQEINQVIIWWKC